MWDSPILKNVELEGGRVWSHLKIDRVKYSIRKVHLDQVTKYFIKKRGRHWEQNEQAYVSYYEFFGRSVTVLDYGSKNFFYATLRIDDPYERLERSVWEVLKQLPKGGALLSEVELANDLYVEREEDIQALLDQIVSHFTLPWARPGGRWDISYGETLPDELKQNCAYTKYPTYYFGSQRGGPRWVKVYVRKAVSEEQTSFYVRVEWTIHGNFSSYGIAPENIFNFDRLRINKLCSLRKFDSVRAGLLLYMRRTGQRIRKNLPPQDLLDKYEQDVLSAMENLYIKNLQQLTRTGLAYNPPHHNVIMGKMAAYKKLSWYKPQDMAKVFPKIG